MYYIVFLLVSVVGLVILNRIQSKRLDRIVNNLTDPAAIKTKSILDSIPINAWRMGKRGIYSHTPDFSIIYKWKSFDCEVSSGWTEYYHDTCSDFTGANFIKNKTEIKSLKKYCAKISEKVYNYNEEESLRSFLDS